MNKLEEITKKFVLLKNKLDKSDILFLCNHSFRSLAGGINGLYKVQSSPNNTNTNSNNQKIEKKNKTETKINISNFKPKPEMNNKNDYLKNFLTTLESTKKNPKNDKNKTQIKKNNKSKSVTPSIKEQSDNSPTIFNDDENHINKNEDLDSKSKTNKLIPLNEDEDEDEDENTYSINNNNKKQLNINSKKQKNKIVSINIIDKNDKNFNIKEKIIEKFSQFDSIISGLTKDLQKMNSIEAFYNEQKQKIISVNLVDNNIIHIEAIKKIIHLFFNTLSKIFNFLAKETENICNLHLNKIFDIIILIIDFVKQIIKFIKNNNNSVDVLFIKNIKLIGNYCLYVLYIKKYNYEYMLDIQKRKDDNKINEFFNKYMKYLKITKKTKNILKDNDIFTKHFMVQPNMISIIDLFEMNRKIINYQLNVNFK